MDDDFFAGVLLSVTYAVEDIKSFTRAFRLLSLSTALFGAFKLVNLPEEDEFYTKMPEEEFEAVF